MSSERDVLEVFERANPVPNPDLVAVEPDASRFLAALLHDDPTVVRIDTINTQPTTHHPRWVLPALAATVVAIVIAGLVAVTRGDADAPAPADTVPATPPVVTVPATTPPNTRTDRDDTSGERLEREIGTILPSVDPALCCPNNPPGNRLDDFIYRSHPELWQTLFGPVETSEAAAEQDGQQVEWGRVAAEECPFRSHCQSDWVPAPVIADDSLTAFSRQLADDGRWTPQNREWYGPPKCGYSLTFIDPDGDGPSAWGIQHEHLAPTRPGVPTLWLTVPARASAEQAEVVVGWLLDEAWCNPDAESLPHESLARGYVTDDTAAFGVTHPAGGVVIMRLEGDGISSELIEELASLAQLFLVEAIG